MKTIVYVVLGLTGMLLAMFMLSLESSIPASTRDCLSERRLILHRIAVSKESDLRSADTNLTFGIKKINQYLPVY